MNEINYKKNNPYNWQAFSSECSEFNQRPVSPVQASDIAKKANNPASHQGISQASREELGRVSASVAVNHLATNTLSRDITPNPVPSRSSIPSQAFRPALNVPSRSAAGAPVLNVVATNTLMGNRLIRSNNPISRLTDPNNHPQFFRLEFNGGVVGASAMNTVAADTFRTAASVVPSSANNRVPSIGSSHKLTILIPPNPGETSLKISPHFQDGCQYASDNELIEMFLLLRCGNGNVQSLTNLSIPAGLIPLVNEFILNKDPSLEIFIGNIINNRNIDIRTISKERMNRIKQANEQQLRAFVFPWLKDASDNQLRTIDAQLSMDENHHIFIPGLGSEERQIIKGHIQDELLVRNHNRSLVDPIKEANDHQFRTFVLSWLGDIQHIPDDQLRTIDEQLSTCRISFPGCSPVDINEEQRQSMKRNIRNEQEVRNHNKNLVVNRLSSANTFQKFQEWINIASEHELRQLRLSLLPGTSIRMHLSTLEFLDWYFTRSNDIQRDSILALVQRRLRSLVNPGLSSPSKSINSD